MAKQPTAWASRDGSSTSVVASGDLLLEAGSYLLLENGNSISLEAITMTPKKLTSWTLGAKNNTAWMANDGFSTLTLANTGVQRTQQDTTVRILQDGTTRLLE